MAAIAYMICCVLVIIIPWYTVAESDLSGIILDGDIMVGGIFPVHTGDEISKKSCLSLNKERGIQRLEAMRFSIMEINNDDSILKGLKLGTMILDSCSDATHALDESLNFVMSTLTASQTDKCSADSASGGSSQNRPIVSVIGAAFSGVSLNIANLLRLFEIPQISYASTSAELSNKDKYGYFMRTVPPDKLQAQAFADIVRYFNWTYVSTVASAGEYGESGIESFKKQYKSSGQCIAAEVKIRSEPTAKDFEEAVINLYSTKAGVDNRAKVVILFVSVDDATGILSAATRLKYYDDFIWVASEGWGNAKKPVANNEQAAQGALTITLKSQVISEFDTYFNALSPTNNLDNIWFQQYWEKTHNCTLLPNTVTSGTPMNTAKIGHHICTGNEIDADYEQEAKIQFVYDAVYALAFSLDRLYRETCGENATSICSNLTFNTTMRTKLMKYIKENKRNDPHGNIIRFDENGDSLGFYNIMNYQKINANTYGYIKVGSWNDKELDIDLEHVQWPGGALSSGELPMSICSVECDVGWRKDMIDEHQCCWKCEKCKDHEYMLDEFTCHKCEEGEWPLQNMSGCRTLELQHVKWSSAYAIVPSAFSIIGLMATVFTGFVFINNAETPVVRAAGRELSYMLLAGCCLCYIGVFVLLAKPTLVNCVVQRFFIGAGFAIIYSALLTKTNRIYRIFSSASKTSKRPAYISPRSQVAFASLLSAAQIIVFATWLAVESPGTRTEVPNSSDMSYVVLKCKLKESSLLISLTYNMALIIVCTVHAVFTRNIPSDYNESKFIGFTMYTTCIIWLSFCPVYFGMKSSYTIQVTTLCTAIILSASVALVCLFGPKVYIILFKPEKNRRKTTVDRQRFSSVMKSQYTRSDSVNNETAANRSPHSSANSSSNNGSGTTPRKSSYSKEITIPEEETPILASCEEGERLQKQVSNGRERILSVESAVQNSRSPKYSSDINNSIITDDLSINSSTAVLPLADDANLSMTSDPLDLYKLKQSSPVTSTAQSLNEVSKDGLQDTSEDGLHKISSRFKNGDSGIAIYSSKDDPTVEVHKNQSQSWDENQSESELPERLI